MLNLFRSSLTPKSEVSASSIPQAEPNNAQQAAVEQVIESQNPINNAAPSLSEGNDLGFSLSFNCICLKKEDIIAIEENLKIAQDGAQEPLVRFMHALKLPPSIQRDAVFVKLCLNDFPEENASLLATCIVNVHNLKNLKDLLGAYLNKGKSLHTIVSGLEAIAVDETTKNNLLKQFSKHTLALTSLIHDESVPIEWRLVYTFCLSAETTEGEKSSAYQKAFEMSLMASPIALLNHIQSVVEAYPNSPSRNPMLEKFIHASNFFTASQRIILLNFMGESVQKDNLIASLIQQEDCFTVAQRKECASAMSEGPQKEAFMKELAMKIVASLGSEEALTQN